MWLPERLWGSSACFLDNERIWRAAEEMKWVSGPVFAPKPKAIQMQTPPVASNQAPSQSRYSCLRHEIQQPHVFGGLARVELPRHEWKADAHGPDRYYTIHWISFTCSRAIMAFPDKL